MYSILKGTKADIPAIQAIAEKTWWPTYSPIVSNEQIRYMLDTIYSDEALLKSMEQDSQNFILIQDENGKQGFASYTLKSNQASPVYKLNKLYVLPHNQGKGYGKILIEEVKKLIAHPGHNTLELNVNRYNSARRFYEKLGFEVVGEEDVPIGPYWMNDYVMRLEFVL